MDEFLARRIYNTWVKDDPESPQWDKLTRAAKDRWMHAMDFAYVQVRNQTVRDAQNHLRGLVKVMSGV